MASWSVDDKELHMSFDPQNPPPDPNPPSPPDPNPDPNQEPEVQPATAPLDIDEQTGTVRESDMTHEQTGTVDTGWQPLGPQDMGFGEVEPVRGPDRALLSTEGPNWGPRSTSAPTIDPTNIPPSHLRLPSQFGHPDDLDPDHGLGCPVCGNELFIVGAADFATGGPSEPRKLAGSWTAHSTCDGCGTRLEFVFEPVDIRIHQEPLTFAAVAEHATRQVEIQAAEDAVRVQHNRTARDRKEQIVRDLTTAPGEGRPLQRVVR